ncbi:YkvA family protein [Hymenobacter aerilatus]|uniref:YkvA family protein n=1 Tax=Hymenobacter aerilatus TaxID=2932251 RepID=UPI0035CBFAE1
MATKAPKGEHVASSPFFKKFLGKAEEYLNKPLRIKQLLNDAYHKAREKNELGNLAHEAWETVQTLIRLVRSASSGEYTGLPTSSILAAVAVLIYFLSPIDVIPDFIPVIGLLDDVALIAWFTSTLKEQLDKFAEWEKTQPVVVEDSPAATGFSATVDSTARVQTPAQAAPAAAHAPAQEAPESAKKAGTTDLSNDDTAPHLHTQTDVAATTTSSSRQPNTATPDTGGNVR